MRDEYSRTIDPARALAAETLNLERTLKAECRVILPAAGTARPACLSRCLQPNFPVVYHNTVRGLNQITAGI